MAMWQTKWVKNKQAEMLKVNGKLMLVSYTAEMNGQKKLSVLHIDLSGSSCTGRPQWWARLGNDGGTEKQATLGVEYGKNA